MRIWLVADLVLDWVLSLIFDKVSEMFDQNLILTLYRHVYVGGSWRTNFNHAFLIALLPAHNHRYKIIRLNTAIEGIFNLCSSHFFDFFIKIFQIR